MATKITQHSDSMIEYTRTRKTDCRECEDKIKHKKQSILCNACRWMFHPECANLSADEQACLKSSIGLLTYLCGWCKTLTRDIQPPWLAYDSQSFFKYSDALLQTEKDEWRKKMKHIQDQIKAISNVISDLQRGNKLEKDKYLASIQTIQNKTNTVDKAVFDELTQRFNEMNTKYETCFSQLEELRKNVTDDRPKRNVGARKSRVVNVNAENEKSSPVIRPTYAEILQKTSVSSDVVRRIVVNDENEELISKITAANVKQYLAMPKLLL